MKKRRISLAIKKEKSVAIKIGRHPLDYYQSPHLLDLSRAKFIERVRPKAETPSFNYQDLPAGDVLSKFYLFEFFSFQDSEIINWLKSFFIFLTQPFKRILNRVDFSPKLPLAKKDFESAHQTIAWEETATVSFLVFIFSSFKKAILFFGHFFAFIFGSVKDFLFKKDEVIEFDDGRHEERSRITKLKTKVEKPDFILEKNYSVKIPKIKVRLPQLNIPKPEISSTKIKFAFLPRLLSFRPLITFIIMAIVIALPLKAIFYWQDVQKAKGLVLGEAEEALNNLQSAQAELMGLNLASAQDYFSSANQDFSAAQEELATIQSFVTALAEILPMNGFKSGKNILQLGQHLSAAGEYLLKGVNQAGSQPDSTLTEKIKIFRAESELALNELKSAQGNLDKVSVKIIPDQNRAQFVELKEKLPLFVSGLESANETADFLIPFLGDHGFKRYLLVFQNDNELRPTGGFMGSFALVDLKDGKIEKINLPSGGTYDMRAGFYQMYQAPKPFQVMNTKWEFQDANWWPDWPTSAQKIAWFYAKSGGPSVDGVIAINSDWMSRLLGVVGGIKMPAYGKTITAANFETEIQKSVELEYDKSANQPKKILSELAPKLIEKLFAVSPENFFDLAGALGEGLKQKDILVYLSDEEQEKFAVKNGWSGEMKDTPKDYLSVVFTNIGGGKTDSVISQEIYHQANVAEDGSIIDRVLISRRHFGPTDAYFTKTPNRSYLRVYVPLGSELVHAAGFSEPKASDFKKPEEYLKESEDLKPEDEAKVDLASDTKIYDENNKTVFANWVILGPGESQDIVLEYKLPFKLDLLDSPAENKSILGRVMAAFLPEMKYDSYSLFVQKQSGQNEDRVVSKLNYPTGYSPQITYPENPKTNNNSITFEGKLTTDLFYFAGLKK